MIYTEMEFGMDLWKLIGVRSLGCRVITGLGL